MRDAELVSGLELAGPTCHAFNGRGDRSSVEVIRYSATPSVNVV